MMVEPANLGNLDHVPTINFVDLAMESGKPPFILAPDFRHGRTSLIRQQTNGEAEEAC